MPKDDWIEGEELEGILWKYIHATRDYVSNLITEEDCIKEHNNLKDYLRKKLLKQTDIVFKIAWWLANDDRLDDMTKEIFDHDFKFFTDPEKIQKFWEHIQIREEFEKRERMND